MRPVVPFGKQNTCILQPKTEKHFPVLCICRTNQMAVEYVAYGSTSVVENYKPDIYILRDNKLLAWKNACVFCVLFLLVQIKSKSRRTQSSQHTTCKSIDKIVVNKWFVLCSSEHFMEICMFISQCLLLRVFLCLIFICLWRCLRTNFSNIPMK